MGLKKDEACLVVTDDVLHKIGMMFYEVAAEMCDESLLILMGERTSHAEEPPVQVAKAMEDADVLLLPTNKSLSHTQARKNACNNGARVASMPEISEDILSRVSESDFGQMAKDCEKWSRSLTATKWVRITTEKGTDISFSIEGREGMIDDGNYSSKGSFGNIPSGEAFVAPLEGTANGRIAVDGSMASIGLLEDPIFIEMEKGYAQNISGGEGARKLLERVSPFGWDARNLAEFAIGTNGSAKLTGNALEDEKILGTIHMALGDNATFGGTVSSPSHLDGILLEPTVFFDDKKVIDKGKWMI